jgi:outer membrane lipoprotein-sorting protein
MTRTQKVEGQVLQEIKLTDIQFNVDIDDKIFDMPN